MKMVTESRKNDPTICEKWKLTVNITETKVMIFRKRKDSGENVFTMCLNI